MKAIKKHFKGRFRAKAVSELLLNQCAPSPREVPRSCLAVKEQLKDVVHVFLWNAMAHIRGGDLNLAMKFSQEAIYDRQGKNYILLNELLTP